MIHNNFFQIVESGYESVVGYAGDVYDSVSDYVGGTPEYLQDVDEKYGEYMGKASTEGSFGINTLLDKGAGAIGNAVDYFWSDAPGAKAAREVVGAGAGSFLEGDSTGRYTTAEVANMTRFKGSSAKINLPGMSRAEKLKQMGYTDRSMANMNGLRNSKNPAVQRTMALFGGAQLIPVAPTITLSDSTLAKNVTGIGDKYA